MANSNGAPQRRTSRFTHELRRHIGQKSLQFGGHAPDFARDQIAAMLAADDVDRAALAKLVTLEHYADAAAHLMRVIRP